MPSREELRAGARGFFYGKIYLHLGVDRQRTSLVRPQTHMAIQALFPAGSVAAVYGDIDALHVDSPFLRTLHDEAEVLD